VIRVLWSPPFLLALALLAWSPRPSPASLRLPELRRPSGPSSRPRAPALSSTARRRAWAATGGLAAGLVVGGTAGVVAGIVVAVAVERVLARQPTDETAVRTARVRDLPAACDLLAVALAAGLPVGEAVAAVGAAVSSPVGADLQQVASLYRLGAEPRQVWAEVPPELAGVGRVLVRAGESGSSVGPALRALAADGRADARAATETAVRRAGVWVLAPLGLCFLPAFLCLGVVPLVLGIAGQTFR
jgi:pilus assembly protein TadC